MSLRRLSIVMSKIQFISVFSYAVVCYIIFSAIVMLAHAGIDCNNLESVCCNRPVVLICKAPQLPIQWKSKDCEPKLFDDDIVLKGGSVKGSQVERDGFVATVVDIKDDFVLTSLEFLPNSSHERQCKIRCEYGSENQDCIIQYEYIKSPLAPIEFKNDSNRYGIITLSWKYADNSIVEHAYLFVQQPSSDEDTHLRTYIVNERKNYIVAGIQANTTYIFLLRVENCMGSNETNITVETEPYSPTTPEFDICTVVHRNVSNIITFYAEVNLECGSQEQIADYYIVRVINKNNDLIHQEYHNTSCGKSYFVLPYEGIFTVEVSALNEYGESQPKSKKLIYLLSFLKDNKLDNMKMKYCIKDVETLQSSANCVVIIKKGTTIKRYPFDLQKCAIVAIPGNQHHPAIDSLSHEAYIDCDPDICYRIIYDGTSGAIEAKGCETNVDKLDVAILIAVVIILMSHVIGFIIMIFYCCYQCPPR